MNHALVYGYMKKKKKNSLSSWVDDKEQISTKGTTHVFDLCFWLLVGHMMKMVLIKLLITNTTFLQVIELV